MFKLNSTKVIIKAVRQIELNNSIILFENFYKAGLPTVKLFYNHLMPNYHLKLKFVYFVSRKSGFQVMNEIVPFFFLVRYMSKSKKVTEPASVKPMGPVFSDKDGNIILQILAKPGAKSNGITNIEDEGVGIQISARPVDGEANSELVKYVMSVLGLKKNEISLEKGLKSRQKVLRITRKDLSAEKIIEKLNQEMK